MPTWSTLAREGVHRVEAAYFDFKNQCGTHLFLFNNKSRLRIIYFYFIIFSCDLNITSYIFGLRHNFFHCISYYFWHFIVNLSCESYIFGVDFAQVGLRVQNRLWSRTTMPFNYFI